MRHFFVTQPDPTQDFPDPTRPVEITLLHRETDSCRLLAHACTVRLKLHLVDLLSTYSANKFATDTQQIEAMEPEPK